MQDDYMVTNYTEAVARNVSRAMHSAGENPNSLALAVGIPRTTLIPRLKGQQPFNTRQLEQLAAHYGIPVPDWFTFIQDAA